MEQLTTKYGILTDFFNLEMNSFNKPVSLMFSKHTEVKTPKGTLVPQYQIEDHGRQQHQPIFFHNNGNLKKIPLQYKVLVDTDHGSFPAELLMFYKDSSLKKLFPLNGKLSGYWSEKNEYSLAEDLAVTLPSGEITAKLINIGFYPSGMVRSLTLWPEEIIEAKSSIGTIKTRKGIAYYDNGNIRSLEPAVPTLLKTPIGSLSAFDNDPEGICGDVNSLKFNEAGDVVALCTISDSINVVSGSDIITYEPLEQASICSDLVKIAIPLLVEFIDGKVRFNNSKYDEYEIEHCSFSIKEYTGKTVTPSYECG